MMTKSAFLAAVHRVLDRIQDDPRPDFGEDDAYVHRIFRETIRGGGNTGGREDQPDDIDVSLARIRARMRDHSTESATARPEFRPRWVRPWTPWRMSLAASLALVLVISGTFLVRTSGSNSAAQRYVTVPGQRATVSLADGSVLTLAPATSVSVSSGSVEVEGEVYFSVAPRATRPLVIRTRNAVAQVLGTAFVVRHYAEERQTRVVVEEGRVAVRSRNQATDDRIPTVLSSRMMAQVSDSGVTVSSVIGTGRYTNWMRGTLVFDRVPLRDVAVELSRAYGTRIRVADSVLAGKTLVAEVQVAEPLPRVLDIITATMNAQYSQEGGAYVLSPGGPTRTAPSERSQPRRFPEPEKMYGK